MVSDISSDIGAILRQFDDLAVMTLEYKQYTSRDLQQAHVSILNIQGKLKEHLQAIRRCDAGDTQSIESNLSICLHLSGYLKNAFYAAIRAEPKTNNAYVCTHDDVVFLVRFLSRG